MGVWQSAEIQRGALNHNPSNASFINKYIKLIGKFQWLILTVLLSNMTCLRRWQIVVHYWKDARTRTITYCNNHSSKELHKILEKQVIQKGSPFLEYETIKRVRKKWSMLIVHLKFKKKHHVNIEAMRSRNWYLMEYKIDVSISSVH